MADAKIHLLKRVGTSDAHKEVMDLLSKVTEEAKEYQVENIVVAFTTSHKDLGDTPISLYTASTTSLNQIALVTIAKETIMRSVFCID